MLQDEQTRTNLAYRRDSFFARKRHESSTSTRRLPVQKGVRLVKEPVPVRRPKLDERLAKLEVSLHDLSSAWIDALDEWQHAQRSDADSNGGANERLKELEARMRELAQKQQQVGRAFEAAIDNVV